MDTSRILQLAATIHQQTSLFSEQVIAANLSQPSFSPVAVGESRVVPQLLESTRDAIIDATTELHDLLLGPTDLIHRHEANNLVSLHAIQRFGIAQSFPVGEEASFGQISDACGLPEHDTRRIIRHAITQRIFSEPRKGVVTHTAASQLLAENTGMSDWVAVQCEEMLPAALHVVDAMQKWPGSQEPTQTGFALANGTELPIFSELGKSPTRAKRFGSAMGAYASAKGMEPHHLLDNYDWNAVKLAVDVGGAGGHISNMLALEYPHLQLVVQDLPKVVMAAKKGSSPEVAARVKIMAHDFFDPQPIKDADVYLFRLVFHNWSDKFCLEILRALIPALKYGACVLVQDYCLPEQNTIPFWKEKKLRAMDLTMMELMNAREREAQDWASLFQRADGRFELIGTTQPPTSSLSLIEFRWKGTAELL